MLSMYLRCVCMCSLRKNLVRKIYSHVMSRSMKVTNVKKLHGGCMDSTIQESIFYWARRHCLGVIFSPNFTHTYVHTYVQRLHTCICIHICTHIYVDSRVRIRTYICIHIYSLSRPLYTYRRAHKWRYGSHSSTSTSISIYTSICTHHIYSLG